MENSVETLGYGSYLIIDGLNAKKLNQDTQLSEQTFMKTFLGELAKLLELGLPSKLEPLQVGSNATGGNSHLLVLPESFIALHCFVELEALSLRIFSRYDLAPEKFSDALKYTFGVKRISSHLSHHSRTMSKNQEKQKQALLGDRIYTSMRLDKNLLF